MSKNLLALFTFLILLTGATAQSFEPSNLLSQNFSEDQLSEMSDSRILFWNYYVEKSFQIVDIPLEKAEALKAQLESIPFASSEFNAFTIDLSEYMAKGAYLRFEGEEKLLIIPSMEQFLTDFNTFNSLRK